MLARLHRRDQVRRLATTVMAFLVVQALALLLALPAAADQVRDTETWVLNALNIQSAWARTKGQGVTVAVIDSGVDPHVSDLTGRVMTGPDFTGVDTPSDSPFWGVHGTWMASLIVGHGNGPGDADGIIGVAPAARVLSIRVITDQGDPNFEKYEHEPAVKGQDELAEAIRYAVTRGASVISMSLGYSLPSGVVRAALQYAYTHKVVVVASAGNSGGQANARTGQAPYSFPADYPGVLAVGAVDRAGQAASFSSENLSVQVVAPGFRVPAQGRDGSYWLVSGTSPACALTAGVVALIKSKYPQLTDQAVISAITSTTTRASRPVGGYNDTVGFGEVNAGAALSAAARLAATTRAASPVTAAAHFGGGVAAIPTPPVRSRGLLALVLYCLLGVVALALVAAATFRLFSLREAAEAPGEPLPEPTALSMLPRIAASPAGRHAAPRGRGDPGPSARSTDEDQTDARSAPERSVSERGGEW
jgi:subtilisin family serine protease